ncbi:hypothetical protein WN48_07654 [Eufriesea mexicana]|nr:hypothetical protein WN48_07654 [Eufriesea mexicana]
MIERITDELDEPRENDFLDPIKLRRYRITKTNNRFAVRSCSKNNSNVRVEANPRLYGEIPSQRLT